MCYHSQMDNRYQFQPLWVRLWRRRWMCMIPVWVWHSRKGGYTWGQAYSIARGMVDVKMRHIYMMNELP